MQTTSLLDLEVEEEEEEDTSTCSSFTVATVLSRNKEPPLSLFHRDSLSYDDTYYKSGNACAVPEVIGNPLSDIRLDLAVSNDSDEASKSQADVAHKRQTVALTYDVKELHKLRCTSSLIDDSFDSASDDDNVGEENNRTVLLSSPMATIHLRSPEVDESNHQVSLQKTAKKSNCRSDAAKAVRAEINNRSSIFRESALIEQPSEPSTTKPMAPVKTPIRAPYDETSSNSFDATICNSLVDDTSESLEKLDKEATKCRRFSNKFLSVYDDLSAQAIQKSATFESSLNKKKNSRVKRMSAAFSTAVQSVAGGITSQTAVNTHCNGGGSWDLEDVRSLSGKKRPRTEISTASNLSKSWGGSLNYVQMQVLAEREEERKQYNQQLKNFNAQIKYLQHENLTAYESVNLARSESLVAAQSKKEVEIERDSLKKQIDDAQKECSTMKEAMLALAEAEKHRVKTINRLERKLKKAKISLEKVSILATDAEKQVTSLRDIIDQLQADNKLLSDELKSKKEHIEKECNMHNNKLLTAKKEAKKWQLQAEENCIEIKLLQMKLTTAKKSLDGKSLTYDAEDTTCATPKHGSQTNWGLINAFGAEDVTNGSDLFNQQTYVEKQPLQTAIMSPPDPSSCRLLYDSSSAEKENQPNTSSPLLIKKIHYAKQQRYQKCCLCFKDPSGVMKSCECGQTNCDKRAHSTCLAKFKIGSISSSVSHPGTPVTQMPLILCTGLWKK